MLLRALYDRVIVESVGVGQSETDIVLVSDTVTLCIQPASGDSLQFMKAGIAEIPDIAVVTKADMGTAAARALADLKGALSLSHRDAGQWEAECLAISAMSDKESLASFLPPFAGPGLAASGGAPCCGQGGEGAGVGGERASNRVRPLGLSACKSRHFHAFRQASVRELEDCARQDNSDC